MTSWRTNTIIEIEIAFFRPPPDLAASIVAEASRAASTIYAPQRPSMREPDRPTDRRSIPSPLVGEGAFASRRRMRGLSPRRENPSPVLSYKGRGKELRLVLPSGGWLRTGNQVRRSVSSMKTRAGSRCRILMIVAKLVGLAHRGRHVLVVFHQLTKHFARRHVALIVVLDGLPVSDCADRAHGGCRDLATARQLIGGRESRRIAASSIR